MKEDVPLWVAALSAGSALLGAVVGMLGTLWHARQERKEARQAWLRDQKHAVYDEALQVCIPLQYQVLWEDANFPALMTSLDKALARLLVYGDKDVKHVANIAMLSGKAVITAAMHGRTIKQPHAPDTEIRLIEQAMETLVLFIGSDLAHVSKSNEQATKKEARKALAKLEIAWNKTMAEMDKREAAKADTEAKA